MKNVAIFLADASKLGVLYRFLADKLTHVKLVVRGMVLGLMIALTNKQAEKDMRSGFKFAGMSVAVTNNRKEYASEVMEQLQRQHTSDVIKKEVEKISEESWERLEHEFRVYGWIPNSVYKELGIGLSTHERERLRLAYVIGNTSSSLTRKRTMDLNTFMKTYLQRLANGVVHKSGEFIGEIPTETRRQVLARTVNRQVDRSVAEVDEARLVEQYRVQVKTLEAKQSEMDDRMAQSALLLKHMQLQLDKERAKNARQAVTIASLKAAQLVTGSDKRNVKRKRPDADNNTGEGQEDQYKRTYITRTRTKSRRSC